MIKYSRQNQQTTCFCTSLHIVYILYVLETSSLFCAWLLDRKRLSVNHAVELWVTELNRAILLTAGCGDCWHCFLHPRPDISLHGDIALTKPETAIAPDVPGACLFIYGIFRKKNFDMGYGIETKDLILEYQKGRNTLVL